MKMSKRQRAARKLVLPLIALGLMAMMMFVESVKRSQPSPTAPAHALSQR
ncbi:MAG TPA: hypothetical protein VF403_13810 [Kofleriaceae bacterium]